MLKGVLFSLSNSLLNARKQLVSQAKKALHILYIRIANLDLQIDAQLKLFAHTIVPILTYKSEVCDYKKLGFIESVLHKITNSKKCGHLYQILTYKWLL